MKPLTQRLVTAFFLLVLFAPLSARLLGIRAEAFENRRLAAWPEIRPDSLFDAGTYQAISTYLTDHMPLRRQAVSSDSWIDLEIFGDSPDANVHLGLEDWLFFDADFRQPCVVDTPIPDILGRIARLKDSLQSTGRRFQFLIVPGKHSIYPEYTTPAIRRVAECAISKRRELRPLLHGDAALGYLDLWSSLDAAKPNDERVLYFSNDSHINSLGASLIAKQIVDAVAPGLWEPGSLELARNRRHEGDLTRMMGLPDAIDDEWYEVRRAGVRLLAQEKIAEKGGHPIERFRSVSMDLPLIPQPTLLVFDSAMIPAVPMLRQYFADLVAIHWNSYDPQLFASWMGRVEEVVVTVVERDFYWRTDLQLGSESVLKMFEEPTVFAAHPNPITVCDGSGLGSTTLSWTSSASTSLEVRVDSPSGKLFAQSGAEGTAETGRWVRDGMTFFLQDASGGRALESGKTLATLTLRISDDGCSEAGEAS